MIIAENGLYKLNKVTKCMICLDYVSESIGITLQVFEDENDALNIYNKVIEETSGNKNVHYDSFIRKIDDYLQ